MGFKYAYGCFPLAFQDLERTKRLVAVKLAAGKVFLTRPSVPTLAFLTEFGKP